MKKTKTKAELELDVCELNARIETLERENDYLKRSLLAARIADAESVASLDMYRGMYERGLEDDLLASLGDLPKGDQSSP